MVVLSVAVSVIVGVPVGYAVAQSGGATDDTSTDPYAELSQAPAIDAPSSVKRVPCAEIVAPDKSGGGEQPEICLRAEGMAPAVGDGIPVATMQKLCAAEPKETASKGACADLSQDLAEARNP
jgi:hypothetical protein